MKPPCYILLHSKLLYHASSRSKVNDKMTTGRIISRDEAALLLDISVHELRRRQAAKQLKVARRGTRGEVFYDLDDIELLRLRREAPPPATLAANTKAAAMSAYSAEDAVKVFAELEKGVTVIQCVQSLAIHPSKVEAIAYAYANLSDTIILDALTVRAINELPLDGTFPITKASDVLALLSLPDKCALCQKKSKHMCTSCAIPYVRRKLLKEQRNARSPGEGAADNTDEQTG